ncbi:DNA cytosine methyltransferase [Achromobacter spanius]|uniref:DNA cytosine methyltransferase n=1 Tax=Achromobacter spanius TaxID=217203 RepID=UPI003AF00286
MNELALFAGAGGGILGGHLLGWRTVCAVEYNAYARSVLLARQNDRTFSPFPVWDDVRTFDGRPWRGIVDVVSGGFPCQDVSIAGKGDGLDGERSGLWSEMARIIGEVRPRFAFVENSPVLTSRGLGRVLGDLASLGFDAEWGVLGAHHAGAPHLRDRLWLVAHAVRNGFVRPESFGPDARDEKRDVQAHWRERNAQSGPAESGRQASHPRWGWPDEPRLGRMADGLADRAHRIKAIGNGQIPRVAAAAFHLLSSRI